MPVTQWKYLNEYQWEDARARQLIAIGTNDYNPGEMFVLLNPDTEEVFLLDTQRDDGPRSQGSFEHWLQQHDLSKDTYLAGPEVDELEFEAGETVAAAIARRHRGWRARLERRRGQVHRGRQPPARRLIREGSSARPERPPEQLGPVHSRRPLLQVLATAEVWDGSRGRASGARRGASRCPARASP
ncbi:hypothetical protein [Cystobacter ferrugineus]|uniref:hypothetical protein n=1 Tax=Cystobacter ferrugineus TaxID=83449 RepID=UPI0016514C91|nr:hypothetical protein [Cystobacter ferrugineus]